MAEMVLIECSFCEKSFEKRKARIKYSKNHYCCRECADLHKKEIMKGTNNPRYGTKMTEEEKDFRREYMKEKWKDKEYTEKVLRSREEARRKTDTPFGWDKKSRDKRIKTLLENFGAEHNWSSEECRKKCDKTSVERYGKTSLQLARENITEEVIEKRRRTLIETLYNTTYEEYEKRLTEKEKYYKKVRRITENQPLYLLENYDKRGIAGEENNYHLDHIVPISYGFINNIPPEIIGDISNLQFIFWRDNISKGSKVITNEEK